MDIRVVDHKRGQVQASWFAPDGVQHSEHFVLTLGALVALEDVDIVACMSRGLSPHEASRVLFASHLPDTDEARIRIANNFPAPDAIAVAKAVLEAAFPTPDIGAGS